MWTIFRASLGSGWYCIMNISKPERKALEMLSHGGRIVLEKDDRNHPVEVYFFTREGWILDGAGMKEFKALRTKRLIASKNGGHYAISRAGVQSLQRFRQGM